ncbi:hypothetical protein CROQUDRAFT_55479 [Cronartium quercuum f. sp. fusiforme G11]|uniref:Transposase n=1 Tax=Cronartium quercuum f. sp. fusiforme G11 TaxID=708437 RepID=A0A9P6T4W8_9BASI|nr:hypothetical protein CROQUDRAFT_55479 [Cronartium quercuum f. sp. fusiforme G11]
MPSYSPDFKLLAMQMWIQQVLLQVIQTTLQQKISKSSLNTWAQLLRTTGSVTCNKLMYAKLGSHVDIVTNDPSIFIDKLQLEMENVTGERVAKLTIWWEMHKCLGLTLHKTHSVDPHQSAEDWVDYVARITGIPPECLVFIGIFFTYLTTFSHLFIDVSLISLSCSM